MTKYVVINVQTIVDAIKSQLGDDIIIGDIEDTEEGIVVSVNAKYHIPIRCVVGSFE